MPEQVRTKHAVLSLEEIAEALPGTGEVMASVSLAFGMCWHAADGGNWDLSAYYLRRARKLLRGLAVTRPKYTDQLRDFDCGVMEELYQSVMARDRPVFDERYQRAVDEANGYHVDTGHPYIRWARPGRPPDGGLDLSG